MQRRGTWRENPETQLRARGNLSYLDFVRLVGHLWAEAHPDIPFVPSGGPEPARYPCIYYSLDLRKAHNQEPKPRHREGLSDEEGNAFLMSGQRFQNIVKFTCVGEAQNVNTVEKVIEVFEDFMLEFTPIFKEMGASELVYARRYPDGEENRPGAGIVRRSVAYMLTTEKVRHTKVERLKQILIDVRTWMEQTKDEEEPTRSGLMNLGGEYSGSSKRILTQNTPLYTVVDSSDIRIPLTNFMMGDLVYLAPRTTTDSPMGVSSGYYIIGGVRDPGSEQAEYQLMHAEWEQDSYGYYLEYGESVDDMTTPGEGVVFYFPDTYVRSRITDQGVDESETS